MVAAEAASKYVGSTSYVNGTLCRAYKRPKRVRRRLRETGLLHSLRCAYQVGQTADSTVYSASVEHWLHNALPFCPASVSVCVLNVVP